MLVKQEPGEILDWEEDEEREEDEDGDVEETESS